MRARWTFGALGAVACAAAVAVASGGTAASDRGAAGHQRTAVPPGPSDSLRELAKGKFLVARPHAGGPFFRESVVLLLDYGPGGTVGLIINRPTAMELAELLPEVGALKGRSERAFFGGPVERNRMMLLFRASEPPPKSRRITGDIHASGSIDALRAVLESGDSSSRFRAYVGYAGWAPGQLEGEVRRGDWHIAPGEARAVFEMESEKIWREFIERSSTLQAAHRDDARPGGEPRTD
jgi:putative transcriptional regulator